MQLLGDLVFRPRVELLEPHDRDRCVHLVAPGEQLVRELAAAEEESLHGRGIGISGVGDHELEAAVLERRHR